MIIPLLPQTIIMKNFYPSFIAFMTSQDIFIIKNTCYRKPLWTLEVGQHWVQPEGQEERVLYKNFAATFVLLIPQIMVDQL